MKIWKYALKFAGNQQIIMPEGAEVLSVGIQYNEIVLWAKVDPNAIQKEYQFYIVGTDEKDIPDGAKHLGSIQQAPFVWHVFQE